MQLNNQKIGTPLYQQVANEFGIPKTTLIYRVQNGPIVQGSIFTSEEEEKNFGICGKKTKRRTCF